MSTETASTSALLAEGRGVVIRDTRGIGEPVLGQIVQIGDGYALVAVEGGRAVRFELSTGCAMLPGEHERWKLTVPGRPGSDEHDVLLARQEHLRAERARISGELALVTAVLDAAEADAAMDEPGDREPCGCNGTPHWFSPVTCRVPIADA